MRSRKILIGIIVSVMSITFMGRMPVHAKTTSMELNNSVLESSIDGKYMEVAAEEIIPYEVPGMKANVMDRKNKGEKFSTPGSITMYSNTLDNTTNNDPNNAYIVSNDTVTQGRIEINGEMRWYAFELNKKSKVTVLLQMVEALDADLYMFSLNEETYELELVGGSATDGFGAIEYYNDVLDTGIYYFAIGGYEGTGNFAFAYYQSSTDANNEINDTMATATRVSFDKNIYGVIDTPYDVDYYQFTVTSSALIRYSLSTYNNDSLLYAGKSGSSAAIYSIGSGNLVKVMPGTYYFAVVNENDAYSASSTYTVNFEKVADVANDNSANLFAISEEAGIVFQTNPSGSAYYVNGNEIDISYSYYQNLSNPAGSQLYDIKIEPRNDVYAYIRDGVSEPSAVYYLYSTRPAMNVSSRPVLELTLYSDTNFYKVPCRGTGAYAQNTFWHDFNAVTVLIDPNTGKLVDIVEFNYYYDFAPVGSNSLTFTRPYKTTFYYDR